MGIRKKVPATSANDPVLETLLEGVNPTRSIQEKKFQGLLDHYNTRNENKEESLGKVSLYIFRTWPRIDNTLSGRTSKNVEKFECLKTDLTGNDTPEINDLPADIRGYITARHGGGRYRVSLNDGGRAGAQVAQTAIKVDEIEYPPILDPKELVSTDAETAGWITRQVSLGQLVRTANGGYAMPNDRTRAAAGAGGESEPKGMADVALEALRQARAGDPIGEHSAKRAIDMVADAAERLHTPTDPVAQVTAIAQALKGGGDGGAMTAMCGLLSTMVVENNKMVMFMMAQRNPAPRDRGDDDPVDKADRILEMLGKYGGPKPSGGGILDVVKEWAPMILPLLLMGKMNPAQAVAAVSAMRAPGGANGIPGGPAPADTAAPGGLTMEQAEDFAGRAAQAMQRGHSGDDFGLGIEVIFSPQTYDMIRQMGRDNIIAFLLQSRQGQFFAQNGPQTTAFIEAFLAYGEPEDNGAPAAATTPAAAGAAAPPPPPPGTPAAAAIGTV